MWQATPPPAEILKSWTSAKWDEGILVARGWSCVCELDPQTGAVISSTFTK